MQNPAARNSERDANGVDSQKHLQRTQHSEQRILMMFGAEKSVALKQEESEDPRLTLVLAPRPKPPRSDGDEACLVGNSEFTIGDRALTSGLW